MLRDVDTHTHAQTQVPPPFPFLPPRIHMAEDDSTVQTCYRGCEGACVSLRRDLALNVAPSGRPSADRPVCERMAGTTYDLASRQETRSEETRSMENPPPTRGVKPMAHNQRHQMEYRLRG